MNADLLSRAEQEIELVLRMRRARSDILGLGLFSDPAWDILLQLLLARLKGRRLALKDLLADVPQSTVARWAAVLEERGLIVGRLDAMGPSPLWIELSDRGVAKMSRLLEDLVNGRLSVEALP